MIAQKYAIKCHISCPAPCYLGDEEGPFLLAYFFKYSWKTAEKLTISRFYIDYDQRTIWTLHSLFIYFWLKMLADHNLLCLMEEWKATKNVVRFLINNAEHKLPNEYNKRMEDEMPDSIYSAM